MRLSHRELKEFCEIYNPITRFSAILCEFNKEKNYYIILREDGRARIIGKDYLENCWVTTGKVYSSIDEYARKKGLINETN